MNDKDTIYRQKTIDDILQLMPTKLRDDATVEEQINYVAWRCALGCAISVVGTQPIAEPQRKKGKWVKRTMLCVIGMNALFAEKKHHLAYTGRNVILCTARTVVPT